MRTGENRITNRVKYFTTSSLSSSVCTPICECGIYLLHTRKWGLFNSTMCAHITHTHTVFTFREFGFCTLLFSLIKSNSISLSRFFSHMLHHSLHFILLSLRFQQKCHLLNVLFMLHNKHLLVFLNRKVCENI